MRIARLYGAALLGLSGLLGPVSAQQEVDPAILFDMSLDRLLSIKLRVASRTESSLLDAPAVVSLITAEDIRLMGARDLRDVLRHVPGFELSIRVFGYPEFGLRGVITDNTEKILILLDGLPVNEHLEGSGTIVFGDLALDNLERIEIIRGPGSALYGTNAFVGVVNLISKPIPESSVVIAAGAGSFATGYGSLRAGWREGEWRGAAFLHWLDTEGDRSDVAHDALQLRPDPPWHSDLNAGISLAGTSRGQTDYYRQKLTAQLQLGYGDFDFQALLIDAKKGPYVGPLFTINENSEAHPKQVQAEAKYNWQVHSNWRLEPRLYWRRYVADNLWNGFPDGYRVPDGSGGTITYTRGEYSVNGATQQIRGGELKSTLIVGEFQTLIAGLSYESHALYDLVNQGNIPGTGPEGLIDTLPIIQGEPDRTLQTAYVQDQWQALPQLAITAGLRSDRYSDAGTSVTPRLAMVWRPTEPLSLKLLYGEAFRAPTFVESYLYAYGGFIRGNSDNKPETIKTHELVGIYRFTDDVLWQLNGYRNRISNLLRLAPNAAGYLEYRNQSDDTVVDGIETELKVDLSADLIGYMNYATESSKNETTGERLIGMARWRANMGLNYVWSDQFNISATVHAVGPRARASFDTREELEGYRVVDVALVYQSSRNWEWRLTAHNLFDADQRFADITGSLSDDFPWEGRALTAELTWRQ